MADNYLENKMEEHRKSPAGVLPRRYSPLGLKRGCASFPFGERNIVVTGCAADAELTAAVVRALGATGSHVAFLWEDIKRGSLLAQSTATRHFPWPDSRMKDVRSTMGSVDFTVEISRQAVRLSYDGKTTFVTGTDSAEIASAVVYALLPMSRQIAFREIHVGEGDVSVKITD